MGHYTGLLLLITAFSFTQAVDWDVVTPLDDYVNRPDPTFSWYELEQQQGDGFVVHILNLTSQKWIDDTYVEQPVWWHYLSIFVPTAPLIYDAAMLRISGGEHTDGIPSINGGMMKRSGDFTRHLGVVSAYLTTVPFQPTSFVGDFLAETNHTRLRFEDQIISYTWREYIEDPEEPNPDKVTLLPMVKASKQAVDAIQQFMAQEYTGFDIKKIMPHGFSKRGWTSWLLACVDRRVFGLVPTVFDLLNVQLNLEHHYKALGGWSWAMTQYWMENVTRYLYHPRASAMAQLIDAFEYNERLTMPKLIIAALGDQFFPPDGSHYFFDSLNGQNFLQLWENDDHTLGDHIAPIEKNMEAFFLAVYRGDKLPEISWTRSENSTHGIITVQTSPSVRTIKGFYADTTLRTCEENRNNTCRRDFRIQAANGKTGIVWYSTGVAQTGIDQYMLALPKRDDFGYRGLIVEFTFEGPASYEFRFTTEVNIVPDIFPYPKCETEEECQGRLI